VKITNMKAYLLAAVMLASCASHKDYLESLPVATPQEKKFAQDELIRCVEAHTKKLDDGVSPADLIARSVVAACRDPYAIVYRTQTQGMSPYYRSGFEGNDWMQTKVRQTTTMVLAIRARERSSRLNH
jgi:hypothetical protein